MKMGKFLKAGGCETWQENLTQSYTRGGQVDS